VRPLTERSSRVLDAVKLQRRAERIATGRFLAEGPNLVEAAARRGLVEDIFVTEAAGARYRHLLADLPVCPVTDRAMKALSETVTPAGLVAVCRLPDTSLDDILAADPALIVVAVDISDPGNAGTLIRLSDAMGAAAVVFAGDAVDPYNGKCVRSSAGSIFAVPVCSEADTSVLVGRLRASGLQILATTLTGELSLDDAQSILGARTVWLFGPESRGLSEEVSGLADRRVVIPMSDGVDSLNVAAAAAICLYQSARAQRDR
jgi:TrmH family RNA methyltransferase